MVRSSLKIRRRTPKGTDPSSADPRAALETFLDRFEPSVAQIARAALATLRSIVPNATEMVYDNYNALVVGFSPSDRPSDAVFSVAVYRDHVSLCFLQGARFADPFGRLRGNGAQVRHIRLEGDDALDDPQLRALIDIALDHARPFDPQRPGRIVVRAVAERQRPRRI